MTALNEACAVVTLGLVFGWCLMAAGRFFVSPRRAAIVGLAAGVLAALVGRGHPPVHFFAGLFLPLGLSLPALALQDALGAFGVRGRRWPAWEVAALLVLYLAFLAASMGAVAFDPYRFGYQPGPVAMLSLALVLYGWLRRDFLIAGVALAGQALWLAGVGGGNYFDHIAHVLLAPVLIAELLKRALRAMPDALAALGERALPSAVVKLIPVAAPAAARKRDVRLDARPPGG